MRYGYGTAERAYYFGLTARRSVPTTFERTSGCRASGPLGNSD